MRLVGNGIVVLLASPMHFVQDTEKRKIIDNLVKDQVSSDLSSC